VEGVSLRDEASPIERARELLAELDAAEAAAWSAWAWEARASAPAFVADAARDVAHDVERLRRSLRAFAAEHERVFRKAEQARECRCTTENANASAFGDEVPAKMTDGCGLYPGADTD
jgi:hypothetical protein